MAQKKKRSFKFLISTPMLGAYLVIAAGFAWEYDVEIVKKPICMGAEALEYPLAQCAAEDAEAAE